MADKVIVQKMVNIYEKPSRETQLLVGTTQITIGDMHANAMKFIYFLVRNGIADISQDDYKVLAQIYGKGTENLTATDLEIFNTIINELHINTHDIKEILLIGDELGDRGENDWFILKIIDKLRQEYPALKTNILFSNHGLEYIVACEKMGRPLAATYAVGAQSQSLSNLQKLIDKRLISRDEVEQINVRSYYPSLKLVSYAVEGDKITIFTHAPSDIRQLAKLAQKLNVSFDDTTIDKLATSIDRLNVAFSKHVHNKTIATLVPPPEGLSDQMVNQFPLMSISWNRDITSRFLDRSVKYKGYQVHYVHGHDSTLTPDHNVTNLDNTLGKGSKNSRQSELHEGMRTYHIHDTTASRLSPNPEFVIQPGTAYHATEMSTVKYNDKGHSPAPVDTDLDDDDDDEYEEIFCPLPADDVAHQRAPVNPLPEQSLNKSTNQDADSGNDIAPSVVAAEQQPRRASATPEIIAHEEIQKTQIIPTYSRPGGKATQYKTALHNMSSSAAAKTVYDDATKLILDARTQLKSLTARHYSRDNPDVIEAHRIMNNFISTMERVLRTYIRDENLGEFSKCIHNAVTIAKQESAGKISQHRGAGIFGKIPQLLNKKTNSVKVLDQFEILASTLEQQNTSDKPK